MKRIFLFASILTAASLQAVNETYYKTLDYAENLIVAIQKNNPKAVEQLFEEAKKISLLSASQKDAILAATEAKVRYHKRRIVSLFDVKFDLCQTICGSLLTIAGLVVGTVPAKLAKDESRVDHDGGTRKHVWDEEAGRYRTAYTEPGEIIPDNHAKSKWYFRNTGRLAGLALTAGGIWKLVKAFGLKDLAAAKQVNELVKQHLFGIAPKPKIEVVK